VTLTPRNWHNPAIITITRLTTYMEDMAENTGVDMANTEEETKEEPARRNIMSVSSLGIG
jgi:hypothetical protein